MNRGKVESLGLQKAVRIKVYRLLEQSRHALVGLSNIGVLKVYDAIKHAPKIRVACLPIVHKCELVDGSRGAYP